MSGSSAAAAEEKVTLQRRGRHGRSKKPGDDPSLRPGAPALSLPGRSQAAPKGEAQIRHGCPPGKSATFFRAQPASADPESERRRSARAAKRASSAGRRCAVEELRPRRPSLATFARARTSESFSLASAEASASREGSVRRQQGREGSAEERSSRSGRKHGERAQPDRRGSPAAFRGAGELRAQLRAGPTAPGEVRRQR